MTRRSWPGVSPLALRVQTDVRVLGQPDGSRDVDFVFPNEIYVLGAAPIDLCLRQASIEGGDCSRESRPRQFRPPPSSVG